MSSIKSSSYTLNHNHMLNRILMTPSPLSYGENGHLSQSNGSLDNNSHHQAGFASQLSYSNVHALPSHLGKSDMASSKHQQQRQQCGICRKEPMLNGKTLIGCLHSFCQSCLMQSQTVTHSHGMNFLGNDINNSSILTCPVCYQETLMPSGGIDALMPHYSNPSLLSDLLLEEATTATTRPPLASPFMLNANQDNG